MAGKFQTGVAGYNQSTIKNWQAYEYGVKQRLLSNSPPSTPYNDKEQDAAYQAGVLDSAAGTIDPQSSYTGQTGPV